MAKNVEEWNSLNHIQLVVAVKKHFKVKLTAAEILNWQNVDEMCAAGGKRLGTE